jgi:hypothetical protein
MEKLLGQPKTGSIALPENLVTPRTITASQKYGLCPPIGVLLPINPAIWLDKDE